ncbi:hypothetical protein GCM10007989_30300 [Devosia pacifica]|uniref:Uncharacterized protein n=1 Tax=Devosia pacifica TaxID=1335967 RepID=A0A918SCG3_9HYPH|nr:hypothetical protein GCM10007989_30300 [Devosia pacifica]
MTGIGDQSERTRQQAANNFCDHEPEGENEADQHDPFIVGTHLRRVSMRVIVRVTMVMTVPMIVFVAPVPRAVVLVRHCVCLGTDAYFCTHEQLFKCLGQE